MSKILCLFTFFVIILSCSDPLPVIGPDHESRPESKKSSASVDVVLSSSSSTSSLPSSSSVAPSSSSLIPLSSSGCGGFHKDDDIFTDPRDCQVYEFVEIGALIWMTKNLDFNDGVSLCPDGNSGNCPKYGRLYNWERAMHICPSYEDRRWRLPFKDEFDSIEEPSSFWSQFSGSSGDNALWSRSPNDSEEEKACYLYLLQNNVDSYVRCDGGKTSGYSVRCVIDSYRQD